jgi:inosine-uridine nucleoside N-ribohydrolase
VDTVNSRPGEISLVAIGSLTNLYGAWLLDPSVFEKTKEIVLMGGYTAPVLYHGFHLEELNFSENPEAAACVLNRGKNISILTGNNTLEPSYLPKEEFMEKMGFGYIAEKCGYRFDVQGNRYGNPISYCWDVVAAVYLLHPELFDDAYSHCFITEHGMHAGWLGVTGQASDTVLLNLPRVREPAAYRQEMYDGWQNFKITEERK